MGKQNQHTEKIECYLRGEMSESEGADFQTELLFDSDLKKELDAMRYLQKSFVADSRKGTSLSGRLKALLSIVLMLIGNAFFFLVIRNMSSSTKSEQDLEQETELEQTLPETKEDTIPPTSVNPPIVKDTIVEIKQEAPPKSTPIPVESPKTTPNKIVKKNSSLQRIMILIPT